MLNSLQIHEIIRKDLYAKWDFKSVLPRDRLPSRVVYPSSYVVNTHESSKKGEHWLALYFDKTGYCTFFDPFGLSPSFYGFDNYLKKTSRGFTFNTQQIQSVTSSVCGYYCIYFVLLMSRNFTLKEILMFFDKKDFIYNDFKILHLL